MNYYNQPYYNPPLSGEPMVYHPKYGYITPKKLERKEIRNNVTKVFGAVLGTVLASYIVGFALGFILPFMGVNYNYNLYPDSYGFPPVLAHLLGYISVVLCTGLPFIIYAVAKRQSPTRYFRFEKVGAGTGFMFLLAGSGVVMLANFPSGWLTSLLNGLGFPSEMPESLPIDNPLLAILYFGSVAIMPAIFEELAIRGVLLSSLRKHGNAFALVISSLSFAFLHYNLPQVFFAFICGLVLGYVYLRTNNLWICIGIHMINNGIAVIMEILYAYLPSGTADIVTTILFYGTILLGIIFLIILIATKRLHFRFAKPEPSEEPAFYAPSASKAVGLLTSPTFIITGIICLFLVIRNTFWPML